MKTNNFLRLLGLDFSDRAAASVDEHNRKIKRDIAGRLSRGSVARQNDAVLTEDELEAQRHSLRGVKLAG